MSNLMFTKGRRLYTTASILTIVVAGIHTLGNTQAYPPEYEGVVTAMRGALFPMGMGMSPSIYDFYWSFIFGISILLGGLGVLGLVLASTTDASTKVLARSAAVFAVISAGQAAILWAAKIPPPLVFFVILTVLWSLSMRTTRFA